ncbi:hypothetical protein DFS34DRAFT_616476 [Phlyctochytrium arcticum]|nr:hypothetical protein DFS34DRAFT_616476 [Phlyctochytrium arcticum]
MPNQEWVNSSKYSSETLPPSVELPWTNKVKLDKMFATDNLEKTKLRKMVRAGIPDSSRGEMYARILRVDKLADYEKHYELALIRTHGKVIPAEPLAPSFGGRTHRHDLALNSKGVVVMDHILCILAHDFPNLEFCPFVPACVALLAHHMRDADELLGAAVSIIKKSMAKVPSSSTSQLGASDPKSMDWAFFPTYRKGVKYLFRAYGNLLHRTNRKVHQVLVEGHKDSPDPIWARWLTSMLIDVLPLPALWRMLDCFVLEGYRALLRFGIGVVIANKDALMKASDMASINAIINSENPLFIAVAPICKAAEGINATRADTVKLQDHHNTLAKLSHSDDIHQPQYRFQRGMPKIVGAAMESESVSSILSDEHWIALWSWIPPSKRVEGLELLFTTKEHGTHVNNMFRRTEERAPLILLVESTEGAVFGAYLSHQFPAPGERTDEWYGNGT